jgi:hypothetical protein
MFRDPFSKSPVRNAEMTTKEAEKIAFLTKTFFGKIREKC